MRRNDMGRRRPRSARSVAGSRDARLMRCARLASTGRMRRALAGYLGLAAESPSCLAAQNRAGDLLARNGQIAQATLIFESVARGFDVAGFDAKAAAVRRKILRLAPAHHHARRALVSWLRSTGRDVDARAVECG